MDIHQINFHPNTPGICEVIEGPSKRAFRTTTRAVGIALLGVETPDDVASTGNIQWTDYLSTHGIAVGTRGKRTYTLGVLPAKERTVNYTGALDQANASRTLTMKFPPILLGLCKEGIGPRSFKKAVVFSLAHEQPLTNLNVTLAANVACSFPYGNIYAGTGQICWGTVPHTHIQSLTDLEELFFGSDFNGDLYYAGNSRLVTLARAYKNKPLPVPAPTINIAGIIRQLSA